MDPRSSTDDHASAAVERRRAFRAFVRAHHPDVGGDPAVFAATVAAYRASSATSRRRARGRPPTDAEARCAAQPSGAGGEFGGGIDESTAVHQSRTRQGDQMRPSITATGFTLGFAGAFGGFSAFVLVAVLGAAGLVAGLVVEGVDLDARPERPRPRQPVNTPARTQPLPAATDSPTRRDGGGPRRTSVADRVVNKVAARAVAEVESATGTARHLLGVSLGPTTEQTQARVDATVDGGLSPSESRSRSRGRTRCDMSRGRSVST